MKELRFGSIVSFAEQSELKHHHVRLFGDLRIGVHICKNHFLFRALQVQKDVDLWSSEGPAEKEEQTRVEAGNGPRSNGTRKKDVNR